jgi:hypothetical protein
MSRAEQETFDVSKSRGLGVAGVESGAENVGASNSGASASSSSTADSLRLNIQRSLQMVQ